MLRALASVAAALLVLSAALAQDGGEPAYDAAAMARVEALIDADPKLSGRYAVCPADVFGSERPFFGDLAEGIELETCERDPAFCHAACTQGQSGDGCFALARAMQENEPATKARYYEGLFTQACALGHGAGCTNRGGGIRNGNYEDDPFRHMDGTVREDCLFRTFEAGCGDEDAWGCAMLGQSYHYGEGVEADEDAALRYYRQSCTIDPDFASCDFARRRIEMIEGPRDEYGLEQEL